jgi:hypothetical protein
MAKWIHGLLISLMVAGCASSQSLDKIGHDQSVIIEIDQLGQLYVVEENGRLVKYSPQGDSLGIFFNKRLGRPTQLDILNPQKILLFYGETNQAVVLDRSLSSERIKSLEAMDQWQAMAIGWTRDQGVWVFSENEQRLIKTDPQGNEVLSSDPVYYFQKAKGFNPSRVIEGRSAVVLSDPQVGFMRFDLFGQYLDTYRQPHQWFMLDRANDTIIYLENGTILSWSPGKSMPTKHTDGITKRKLIMDWLSRTD